MLYGVSLFNTDIYFHYPKKNRGNPCSFYGLELLCTHKRLAVFFDSEAYLAGMCSRAIVRTTPIFYAEMRLAAKERGMSFSRFARLALAAAAKSGGT